MTLFRSSGSSSLSTSSGGAGVFESGIGTVGMDLPKSRGTGTGDGGSGSWDSTGICATGGFRNNPRRPPNKTAIASKVIPAVSACVASGCRVDVLSELMDAAPVLLYPALANDAVVPALKYSTSQEKDNQPVLLAWIRGRVVQAETRSSDRTVSQSSAAVVPSRSPARKAGSRRWRSQPSNRLCLAGSDAAPCGVSIRTRMCTGSPSKLG